MSVYNNPFNLKRIIPFLMHGTDIKKNDIKGETVLMKLSRRKENNSTILWMVIHHDIINNENSKFAMAVDMAYEKNR